MDIFFGNVYVKIFYQDILDIFVFRLIDKSSLYFLEKALFSAYVGECFSL